MKKKLFFALAGYLFLCTSIYAQNKEKKLTGKSNNPPVLVINKEDTTYLDEFLAVYNKKQPSRRKTIIGRLHAVVCQF